MWHTLAPQGELRLTAAGLGNRTCHYALWLFPLEMASWLVVAVALAVPGGMYVLVAAVFAASIAMQGPNSHRRPTALAIVIASVVAARPVVAWGWLSLGGGRSGGQLFWALPGGRPEGGRGGDPNSEGRWLVAPKLAPWHVFS